MAYKETLQKKSVPQLIAIAVRYFHKFIRTRDKDLPCISCGRYTKLQAGHFYSAGNHPSVRFNEDNVHGQCIQCNHFLSANLLPYRANLIKKIGQERVDKITLNVEMSKKFGFKWSRLFLIETILKYKGL
tara:strand:+ start:3986 stop:4375 length:390 start_codon:yes stop_codon:yes gene_type:complete